MSIKQLEEAKKSFVDCNGKENMNEEDALNIGLFMLEVIKTFKELTKNMDNRWREYTYYDDTLKELNKRIKKLEQQDSYYPTEEEIRHIKVGGTD